MSEHINTGFVVFCKDTTRAYKRQGLVWELLYRATRERGIGLCDCAIRAVAAGAGPCLGLVLARDAGHARSTWGALAEMILGNHVRGVLLSVAQCGTRPLHALNPSTAHKVKEGVVLKERRSRPLGPVEPALQRQSVTAVDAAAERESAGHAVHAWLPVWTL